VCVFESVTLYYIMCVCEQQFGFRPQVSVLIACPDVLACRLPARDVKSHRSQCKPSRTPGVPLHCSCKGWTNEPLFILNRAGPCIRRNSALKKGFVYLSEKIDGEFWPLVD
jgi:hypothetical protein